MDLKEASSDKIETIKVGSFVKKTEIPAVFSARYALISVWKQCGGEKICVSRIKIPDPLTSRDFEGKESKSNSEQLLYKSEDGS